MPREASLSGELIVCAWFILLRPLPPFSLSPSSVPHRAATLPPPACPPRAPPRGADHEARAGGRGRGAAPSSCRAARGGSSCGPPRFIRLAGRQLLSRGGPAWMQGGGSIRPAARRSGARRRSSSGGLCLLLPCPWSGRPA
ncbi:hypothetical protein PVAP13_3KG009494 [Panicum virgatum]|uniref:Uncharacterized protein n=1 Tax=Panicum virgatum TaxID=38727 RepID=A0A8T0UFH8_PANVG|nr:hypothetical protein PVAP13_3KG009494 [Panicum virgatum]